MFDVSKPYKIRVNILSLVRWELRLQAIHEFHPWEK
jgi:hypothetical protein